MKAALITVFAGLLLMLAMGTFEVSAHPGKPDNIWTDPLPEFCPEIWQPVHDATGTVYANVMCAAKEGVRVTWNGEE